MHHECRYKLILIAGFSALSLASGVFAEEASPDGAVEHRKNNTGNASAPVKLFGRIEELSRVSGARLPLKMEALTPKRDPSLDQLSKTGQEKSSHSFPVDYLGTWSGELTIHAFNCDKSFFDFDPLEAGRQAELLKAGTRGNCSVTFFRSPDNQTQMQPCSVAFTAKEPAGSSSTLSVHPSPGIAGKEVAFVYYLHLGDLSSGKGVTGNEITCRLMKNTLKELARGVIEQEVVTQDFDRNPVSGKVKAGYSESVLRFTRVTRKQLYLQAASVSYGSDARFQNKVILYGTLTRLPG